MRTVEVMCAGSGDDVRKLGRHKREKVYTLHYVEGEERLEQYETAIKASQREEHGLQPIRQIKLGLFHLKVWGGGGTEGFLKGGRGRILN